MSDRPHMQLLEWSLINRGALVGKATVLLPIGLKISDVAIFALPDGSQWAQLPSEPMRNADGQYLKDDRGKIKYRSFLRWRSRELQDAFSRAVLDLSSRNTAGLVRHLIQRTNRYGNDTVDPTRRSRSRALKATAMEGPSTTDCLHRGASHESRQLSSLSCLSRVGTQTGGGAQALRQPLRAVLVGRYGRRPPHHLRTHRRRAAW